MGMTMPVPASDELHQADVDAFVDRNREALEESIAVSRAEVAQGIYSKRSVDDIIAVGMKRYGAKG